MLWFIPTAPIDAQAVNLDGPYPDRTQVWEPLVAYVWDEWDRQDGDGHESPATAKVGIP